MPRGCKPGERRGGRIKGKPNKATIERALIAEIEAGSGDKLAKERLADYARMFDAMAKFYAPVAGKPNKRGKIKIISGDVALFERWARLASDTWAKLAPYQSPTLRAITVVPPPPEDDGKVTVFKVDIFSAEGKLIEHQPAEKITP